MLPKQLLSIAIAVLSANALALQLSPPIPAPLGKADGRGAPIENLVVKYGADYENDPFLQQDVRDFRQWHWQKLYADLDHKTKEKPDYLDTYRLQAAAYLINKDYRAALSQLDQILQRNPQDVQALALSALAAKTLENKDLLAERLQALRAISPAAAARVEHVFDFTEKTISQPFSGQPLTKMTPDVIAVFGQSPNADGTPSKGLLQRLEKTLQMAQQFPQAKIILSGGAVKTPYAEADVMKKWLLQQGVKPERLFLDLVARDTPGNAIGIVKILQAHNWHHVLGVGTIMHIPRATAVLKGYADFIGYPITIDGVGGGNPPKAEKKKIEKLYTYVNTARVMGIWRKSDFVNLK